MLKDLFDTLFGDLLKERNEQIRRYNGQVDKLAVSAKKCPEMVIKFMQLQLSANMTRMEKFDIGDIFNVRDNMEKNIEAINADMKKLDKILSCRDICECLRKESTLNGNQT